MFRDERHPAYEDLPKEGTSCVISVRHGQPPSTPSSLKHPPIDVVDQQLWLSWKAKNQNDPGARIIAYAERWARLMQIRIAKGHRLEDIADIAAEMADVDGISSGEFTAAVGTLAYAWIYGDQLKRWHLQDQRRII